MSYFSELADVSLEYLSKLPAPVEPQPIAYVEAELLERIEGIRRAFTEDIAGLTRVGGASTADAERAGAPVGLNTVGLLCDRLTILLVKAWVLKEKRQDIAALEQLRSSQIADIVAALDAALPGSSSVNTKITELVVNADAKTFAEAFVKLQLINLQLWESQEVLYLRDVKALPCEELRGYIDFFSRGNVARNRLIELADTLFWA